jgi:hypothetical protein
MRTTLVLGFVSLVWFVAGVTMTATPAWLSGQVQRRLTDPFSRFFATQGMALTGVLVVLGSSVEQRSWFWIAVGSLASAKALFLLSLPAHRRDRLLSWWCARSPGLQRLGGAVAVVLATLLAIDAVRLGG